MWSPSTKVAAHPPRKYYLTENIGDYFQVHIPLPQTRSQTFGPTIATTVTPTVATATPAAKTTRATRKR